MLASLEARKLGSRADWKFKTVIDLPAKNKEIL